MEEQAITIDGYDPFTGETIRLVSLWASADRAKSTELVARLPHGTAATLLERDGDQCRLRVARDEGGSIRVWVTFWFVKELKQEFVARVAGVK